MSKYKLESKCDIIISAGTEDGHEMEELSHYSGYRLNIELNKCHNDYILKFTFIGKKSNGAPQFRDANGNIFTLEGNHWNILFNKC
jgi:hypothetical protein